MTGDENGDDEKGVDVPDVPGGRSKPFARLTQQIQQHGEEMAKMAQQMMKPILEQQSELVEAMQEYYEEVQTAVESTIELEEPWEYNPEESTVHARAERIVENQVYELVKELQNVDDPYFDSIQQRMMIGHDAYTGSVPDEDGEWVDVRPRPHEATFIFISLQDGLMHWLCEQDESVEPDKEYDERNVYHAPKKKETLGEVYTSFHGIAPNSTFMDNLEAFYHHRNYIMHGHPGAYFDMNIATASGLFFILTFHAVIEQLDSVEL